MSELMQIAGSGRGGRITKKDVLRYLERREAAPPAAARRTEAPPGAPEGLPGDSTWSYPFPPYSGPMPPGTSASPSVAPPSVPPSPPVSSPASALSPRAHEVPSPSEAEIPPAYLYRPEPEDTLVPMSAMRKQIAEHMVWSQRIAAQVTSFTECDMHRIVRYREEHRTDFEAAEGIPLTFLPFVAEATVKALKDYPLLNASVLGDRIAMKKRIHLGIAVALEEGLIVPVVRHADEMNFVGLARAIQSLAERARAKKLTVEEVQGATFTVTNPGMFGGLMGTPMIAQPQVAILGLGAIQKKPVVVEDAIAIRPVMVLALTFDHRIIDGATGFQFLERIRSNLEHFDLP